MNFNNLSNSIVTTAKDNNLKVAKDDDYNSVEIIGCHKKPVNGGCLIDNIYIINDFIRVSVNDYNYIAKFNKDNSVEYSRVSLYSNGMFSCISENNDKRLINEKTFNDAVKEFFKRNELR